MSSAKQPRADPAELAELFDDVDADFFSTPEEIGPHEWAEKHRELTPRQSPAMPGPWRNANQPALVGLMALAAHAEVREIWNKKSAQAGGSEAIRNVIAWRADLRPCPTLLVLPNEKKGRKDVARKIHPLFEGTPRLARHLTGRREDLTFEFVALANGFDLALAYAGSTTSIAGDPQEVVVLDEVDKFENISEQADPVDEARVRLRTVFGQGRGLLIANSTPSTPSGPIARGYAECSIQLSYYVPCPHCRRLFAPAFDLLHWEKFKDLPTAKARAERIKVRYAAWMECPHCRGELPNGEPYPENRRIIDGPAGSAAHRIKRQMLWNGVWATPDLGWRIDTAGRFHGTKPEGERVGIHLHGLVDQSVPYAAVAAEFVAADGQRDKLQSLHNLTLGLEFADTVKSVTSSVFRDKCVPNAETGFVPPKAKTVPRWASKLIMTVDTQKEYFWFVIRAWGAGMRSQRVHHGIAQNFEQIEDLYYRAWWPNEDPAFPALRCYGSAPLAIDSGGGYAAGDDVDASITQKVYLWCLKDPTWRWPLKGASRPFDRRFRQSDIAFKPRGMEDGPERKITLSLLDPVYWRDILAGQVTAEIDRIDPKTGEVVGKLPQWGLNDDNDDEYNRHLAAVRKEHSKKGPRYRPITPGARHDFHDVESYQQAWAHHVANCFALPTEIQLERLHKAGPSPTPNKPAGIRTPDGRPFLATQRK